MADDGDRGSDGSAPRDRANATIMRDWTDTAIWVWSGCILDRTVVVGVSGRPF